MQRTLCPRLQSQTVEWKDGSQSSNLPDKSASSLQIQLCWPWFQNQRLVADAFETAGTALQAPVAQVRTVLKGKHVSFKGILSPCELEEQMLPTEQMNVLQSSATNCCYSEQLHRQVENSWRQISTHICTLISWAREGKETPTQACRGCRKAQLGLRSGGRRGASSSPTFAKNIC